MAKDKKLKPEVKNLLKKPLKATAKPKPKKAAKLVEIDEPLPELEGMLQEIPRMSKKRRGRLRQRLHDRMVKHAVKLGLSEEEAKRRIGDGTIIQWFIDHGPQIAALIKMIFSIFSALA